MQPSTSQTEKGDAFRALHEGDPFLIPNPWDAGSAKVLEGLGFKALATTSSGFAFTLGRLDGGVSLEEKAEHIRSLSEASSLPVSADLENGFGPDTGLAIRTAAEAGAVGGSIEDFDPKDGLYPLEVAVERVEAAVEAAQSAGFTFTLTARAENHIRGNPDLNDTIKRLQAYEAAGADVLYAPGLKTIDDVRAVCQAVSKPVNVLAHPRFTKDAVFEAGAQRISVGGGLAFAAVAAFVDAAERMRDAGDFSSQAVRLPLGDWL